MKAKTGHGLKTQLQQLPLEGLTALSPQAGRDTSWRSPETASQGSASGPVAPIARLRLWALLVKRRGATVGFVLLAVWIGYYVIAGQNGLQTYLKKREESTQLTKQINQLQQQNAQLSQQVQALQSDPDAIEHEARERLHYVRPGDVIYTLNAPNSSNSGSIPVAPPQNVLPGQ